MVWQYFNYPAWPESQVAPELFIYLFIHLFIYLFI